MKIRYYILSVASLLVFSLKAQNTFEEGGLVFLEDLSNPQQMQVYVTQKKSPLLYPGQSAYSGDIVLPSEIEHDLDQYKVVGMTPLAFMNCEITSLDIEAPITKIDHNMIYSNTLKRIKLPSSIKLIRGLYAPNLEEIYFGENWPDIENYQELFSYSQPGQIKKVHLPGKEVPKCPCLNDLEDFDRKLIIYVPKGMKEEYMKQWNPDNINNIEIIEE